MNQQLLDMVLQNAQATLAQDLFAAKVCIAVTILLAVLAATFITIAKVTDGYDNEAWGVGGFVCALIASFVLIGAICTYSEALQIRSNPTAWAQHKVAKAIVESLN